MNMKIIQRIGLAVVGLMLEIDEGSKPQKANKQEIVNAAKRRWKQAGRNVMP